MQQAVIKRLMKLRESEIKFDPEEGATFREVFDHPHYLSLGEAGQIEFGLQCARELYRKETERSSLDSHFSDRDLAAYLGDTIMLDVGCYLGGKTIRWLEKYRGAEIHGIDIDPRYIRIANLFAKEKGANAHFKVNFAEEMSFPDAFFDVVLSEDTLEHVSDVPKVMQECSRVLKSAGFMIVLFPSFWNPFYHHLDLVTRTPFIHWFFKYPALLEAYFAILDERGDDALWYRRQEEQPLPFEKGYSINGTGAIQFRRLVEHDWKVVFDGFKSRPRRKRLVENALVNCVPGFPVFRELFRVAYVLQKP